jgi:hypothetical protein
VIFDTYRIADINTRHVTRRDGELMLNSHAPYLLAITKGNAGAFFYIPQDDEDMEGTLYRCGFSEAFQKLFKQLRAESIPYVRFDADGGPVDNAPVFDW